MKGTFAQWSRLWVEGRKLVAKKVEKQEPPRTNRGLGRRPAVLFEHLTFVTHNFSGPGYCFVPSREREKSAAEIERSSPVTHESAQRGIQKALEQIYNFLKIEMGSRRM